MPKQRLRVFRISVLIKRVEKTFQFFFFQGLYKIIRLWYNKVKAGFYRE